MADIPNDREPPTTKFAIGAQRWAGLSKVIEECGEVVQVAGKLLATYGETRHWEGPDLAQRLQDELGDLSAAVIFLVEHSPELNGDIISARAQYKLDLFEMWHTNSDPSPEVARG